MNVEEIAKFVHKVNALYCKEIGEESLPYEEVEKSAIQGVNFVIVNRDRTPEQLHQNWLDKKRADGWSYGPVKNSLKKEHPCCVPYWDLPAKQRVKDKLFLAVVKALM